MPRKEITRASMVGWFNPSQLARTGLEVVISSIFGRHSDRRLLEALTDPGDLKEKLYYDFSEKGDKDFWFDYISDVGDGFDSTYTMAYHLSRPQLTVAVPGDEQTSYETQSGQILVFGGDEVYPIGDKKLYQERLIAPYNAAFPEKKPGGADGDNLPAVFAVPGNHDWYDSLVSFTRIFCEQQTFAGWQTMQNRSYFALSLPHGWWLFGTDMQLGSSLDKPQMDYFGKVMEKVKKDERIILCNAEPHWIKAALNANNPDFDDRNMGFFEGQVMRHQVAVYIAGDLHYYRRHEEIPSGDGAAIENPKQKITAGGGGAFLHPTHKQDLDQIGKRRKFKLRKSFPETGDSAKLCWWNLLFPVWNPWFGVVTGLLYLLTAKAFMSDLGKFQWGDIGQALTVVARDALVEPFAIFWVLAILLGFAFFTGKRAGWYRYTAGPVHALVHLFAIFVISWQVSYWLRGGGFHPASICQLLLAGLLIFAGGWIIGSFIFGIYLLISLNVFGRHHNEAFSAIKSADFKNFVRFKIEENGDLLIFPMGVRRVVKNWQENTGAGEPRITPVKLSEENKPFLIEAPVRSRKASIATPAPDADPPEETTRSEIEQAKAL